MNSKANLPVKKKQPLLPKQEDFSSRQMDLFHSLLCNTDAERDSLPNVGC